MDPANLTKILRDNIDYISCFEELVSEVQKLQTDQKNLQGLSLGLQAFANSVVGEKLKEKTGKRTLRLIDAINQNAVTYISLRPLEFPEHARSIARLFINDLKATLSKLMVDGGKPVLIVFDEFSSFGGDEILNIINQGRSAGAHVITGTQSIADLERKEGQAFKEQLLANHKTFLIYAQTTPNGAEFFSKVIGTKLSHEPTVQIDNTGVTGVGSIREIEEFIKHPNEFKNLKQGEAMLIQNLSKDPAIKIKTRKSKI